MADRRVLVAAALALLAVLVGALYYSAAPGMPLPTESPPAQSTQTTGPARPRITDVVSVGFVLAVDEPHYKELYWRIEIHGEVDLREKVEIGGVYGWWFGTVTVYLPDGRVQDRVHEPPDYFNVFQSFQHMEGSKTLDVYIPTEWFEEVCLEGVYRVVVWLQGPYENRTVLFDKSFTLRMSLEASVGPTRWSSWSEALRLELRNSGDVPVILRGAGIELRETGTVIGWATIPEWVVVMPGESATVEARADIREEFREQLRGETEAVSFRLGIVGAPREYAVEVAVEFPTE